MGIQRTKSEENGPSCPVCGVSLSRQGLVLCRKCQTPHHRRCWSYNKGCGVYGCKCRVMEPVALSLDEGGSDPRLHFAYHQVTPDDRFGAFWAVVLLLVLTYHPAVFLPLLGALVLPMLLSVEHTANLETGMLERRRRLGPVTFWRRLSYLPLHQVESLELRRRGTQPKSPWEVWVRDTQDRATLLDVLPPSSLEEVMERLEFPAEQIDTVISLPRNQGEEASLPAGLERTLRGLPGSSEQDP